MITVGMWVATWGAIIMWTMIGDVFKWTGVALMVVGLLIAGISEDRLLKRIEKLEGKYGR